jgi:hypothetical protein
MKTESVDLPIVKAVLAALPLLGYMTLLQTGLMLVLNTALFSIVSVLFFKFAGSLFPEKLRSAAVLLWLMAAALIGLYVPGLEFFWILSVTLLFPEYFWLRDKRLPLKKAGIRIFYFSAAVLVSSALRGFSGAGQQELLLPVMAGYGTLLFFCRQGERKKPELPNPFIYVQWFLLIFVPAALTALAPVFALLAGNGIEDWEIAVPLALFLSFGIAKKMNQSAGIFAVIAGVAFSLLRILDAPLPQFLFQAFLAASGTVLFCMIMDGLRYRLFFNSVPGFMKGLPSELLAAAMTALIFSML